MSHTPNIISTPLVSSQWDWLWQDFTPTEQRPTPLPLLIISQPRNEHENQVLTNMMKACRLSSEQYFTLELDDQRQVPWPRIREAFQPKHVLLLGVSPVQLGINAEFKIHQPNSFDQSLWIPALTIEVMESKPEFKKALWTQGLKPLFDSKEGSQP